MQPPLYNISSGEQSPIIGRGGEYADATLSEKEFMDAEYELNDPITGQTAVEKLEI